MNAPVSDGSSREVRIGAARVALAGVWCAFVQSPEVFQAPRFAVHSAEHVGDANATAEYLASLVTPVYLTPVEWDGETLHLEIDATAVDNASEGDRVPDFHQSEMSSNRSVALVVGGGRALRVDRRTIDWYRENYRINAAGATAGGPPDDPWTTSLQLPPAWLDGVAFVYLLGSSTPGQFRSPVRMSSGFDPALIDDVVSS